MIRVKYKLFNGVQPQDVIRSAVPSINKNDLFMGKFPRNISNESWYYGEINSDSGNAGTIATVCVDFGLIVMTDEEAVDWADSCGVPPETQIQEPVWCHAAQIINDMVVRLEDSNPPA